MRYIGIIILLVLCLTLLLLTGCMINTVKPEPASGNLENQEDINQSSNNFQSSSIGLVYESAIVDTGEPGTVYPQQWATGDGAEINGVPAKVPVPVYENICHNPASICPLKVTVIPLLIVNFPPRSNLPLINTRIHAKIQKNYLKRYLPSLKKRGTYVKTQSNQIKAKGQ